MMPVLAMLSAAYAQSEPPLAIPADPPSEPPPDVQIVEDERPLGIPGNSRALREYRNRYLAVRRLSEVVRGYGGWYGGWGAWPHPWVYRVESWVVTKGQQRLDVPNTLTALGDVPARQALERRIRKNRTAAALLTGAGVAGVITSVVGLIGVDQATTWDDRRDWSNLSVGGLGLAVGGFVGASFPSRKAVRLQLEPEATFDIDVLQQRVADHNERLARELGLDPDRAVGLER